MRGMAKAWLSAAGLVVVFACDVPTVTFNPPPVDTYTIGTRQMKIDDAVTPVQAAVVTPGFFAATGIQPALGRFITKGDEGVSPTAVAVLSHELWAARFGSSPSVIGQQIELDEQQFTVVGVAPKGFRFPGDTLVWTSKSTRAR